jgi:hypothetical protein
MAKESSVQEVALNSWEEFQTWLKENWDDTSFPQSLFRGQPDGSWGLVSSLERYSKPNFSVSEYHNIVLNSKPKIETYLNRKWDIDTFKEITDWLECISKTHSSEKSLHNFPGYELFIYLRHHGFPSPLLDWTESPYIAAFFAFQKVTRGINSVSIYLYRPAAPDIGFSLSGPRQIYDRPLITVLGPYITSDKRHFQQQAQYTICTKLDEGFPVYASYEEAIEKRDSSQEKMIKLIFPASEKENFLNRLNHYNLNAYSLFQSDESLCETIAFKEFSRI